MGAGANKRSSGNLNRKRNSIRGGAVMAGKRTAEVSRRVAENARKLLAFAEEQAEQAEDWVTLHNALFGIGGKAAEVFATEPERTAFSKTPECKRIFALM